MRGKATYPTLPYPTAVQISQAHKNPAVSTHARSAPDQVRNSRGAALVSRRKRVREGPEAARLLPAPDPAGRGEAKMASKLGSRRWMLQLLMQAGAALLTRCPFWDCFSQLMLYAERAEARR